jgi:hypothetical protein
MADQLIVILWGLLAVALITGIGRYCRMHDVPASGNSDTEKAIR